MAAASFSVVSDSVITAVTPDITAATALTLVPTDVIVTVPNGGGGADDSSPSTKDIFTFEPAGSPPPCGVLQNCQSGANPGPGGSASATSTSLTGSITATGAGVGAVTDGRYATDPVGAPSFNASGSYFDVGVSIPNAFTSVTIDDCDLNGGTTVQWWNPAANGGTGGWQPASAQTFSAGPPPCVTLTVDATTSPSLAELTGTVFAAAGSPGSPFPGGTGPLSPPTAARVSGADRVATAIAASQDQFPTQRSAGAVIVARDDQFPDGLTGAPLAAAHHGPLLLTDPRGLDPGVATEIVRVLPPGGTVYILGGPLAVDPSTDSVLSFLGFVVVRYAGTDRYDTARIIADQGLGNPSTILLATGLDFPDGLAAGPAAAVSRGAVLLTKGDVLHPTTAAYLAAHPSDSVYAIGGPAGAADPSAAPIVGPDRYATAAEVAHRFFPNARVAGVATGVGFPDALSGGAEMAGIAGPILLTEPSTPSSAVLAYLRATPSVAEVKVFGGPGAIAAGELPLI